MLEEELYEPVKLYLEEAGFKVNAEVGNCDVFGVKADEIIVVELKRGLTIELLTQAVERQKISDRVYMAVPKPKRFKVNAKWRDTVHLIRRLELGLIFVNAKNKAEIIIEPEYFDRTRAIKRAESKRKRLIKEAGLRTIDANKGGSKGKKIMTSYRESAVKIGYLLMNNGIMSPKELRVLGTDKERTTNILYSNHYGWFERIGKGKYKITEAGIKECKMYNEIIEGMLK